MLLLIVIVILVEEEDAPPAIPLAAKLNDSDGSSGRQQLRGTNCDLTCLIHRVELKSNGPSTPQQENSR